MSRDPLPAARAFRGATAKMSVAFIALIVIVALSARWITPHNPSAQPALSEQALAPSLAHPFGTDRYSRDVLSRMIVGAQVSLGVAASSVLIALIFGTTLGAFAGYAGGATDRWIMRGVDAVLSIPRLLVLIFVVAAFPQLSVLGFALVLGLTGWPPMSRIVRAQVREVAAMDYVLAARALGVRPVRILWRHVLPAVVPQMLVVATLSIASVIPLEAGLSFLGLGIKPPIPSWGNIIVDSADLSTRTWWLLVFPGVAIASTVLSVNVIGERLRDALDPRLPPAV